LKGRKHSPEQIIRKLREADRMLAEGKTNAEIAKALEVTEWTMSRWRNQYGGLKGDDAKRLKELEKENSRLKRIVADQTLDIDMLKEIARVPQPRPDGQVGVDRRGSSQSLCGPMLPDHLCKPAAPRC
jgi:putative transposase